jgi:hypothetical protein
MKGNMKAFAHPIADTKEWCHEHKESNDPASGTVESKPIEVKKSEPTISDEDFDAMESAGTSPVNQPRKQIIEQASDSSAVPVKEHFCDIHATMFLKRGTSWAHPIFDINNKETGKWCVEQVAKLI